MNRTARFEYIPNTLMQALDDVPSYEVKGKVLQVVGTIVRASVPGVKVGEICILRNSWEDLEILAEVVGFAKGEVLLTALGRMQGISTLTEVIPTHRVHRVGVGPDLLGHVVDGALDGRSTRIRKASSIRKHTILCSPIRPTRWNAESSRIRCRWASVPSTVC